MIHAYGIGTVLNETYRLERELGRSGLGTVYGGSDLVKGRECVVRVLPAGAVELIVERERFLRDHKIVAQIADPRLPAIEEMASTADGALFIVTPPFRGETLRQRLRRGVLVPRAGLALLQTLCEALCAAHQRSVPHGDVRPENVVLGRGDKVLLVDLGLHHFRSGLRVVPRRAPGA